jgi:hypothetical protein
MAEISAFWHADDFDEEERQAGSKLRLSCHGSVQGECKGQFCGSEMFIPDSGSRIRIHIKGLILFNPKINSKLSDPDLIFYTFRIPDPEVKKAPDPGSATLERPNQFQCTRKKPDE